MIKNYFVVAYRNLVRGKWYSFINIAGLAIGITCSLLIGLYVADELGYDQFHSKHQRIFRVNEFFEPNDGSGERSSSVPFPLGEAFHQEYENKVQHYVRLFNFQAPALTIAYEAADKEFNERNFFFVDSTYHRVFDWQLVTGNEATALSLSNSVVISETIAKKYFPNDEPLGKQLRFQGRTDLLVTGVMKDMPLNSHFRADFLGSFATLREFYDGRYPEGWFWNPCWTYLLLHEGVQPVEVEHALPQFVQKYFPDFIRNDIHLKLQPLTDIHLKSNLEFEITANSNENNVYLFSAVAVFVLLIAGINFINLSTARSIRRAKEVGLRKAIGVQKYQLVLQFMLESVIMALLAMAVALVALYLLLPWFNNFSGKILFIDFTSPVFVITILAAGVIVGILAGIYPAFVITSFNPVVVLKSKVGQGKGFNFRKALVVVQFSISIALIIATGVAMRQLDFLQQGDVGFTRDNIIMLPAMRTALGKNFFTFADELTRDKNIYAVTATEEIVGAKYQGGNYQFEGMEKDALFSRLNVRHDFLKTFEVPVIAGRDYSRDMPTDDSLALVVNRTLVKRMGWTPEQAIGKHFNIGNGQGEIVGVTEDFNFASKHVPIGPLVLQLNTEADGFGLFLKYVAVRVNPENTKQALATIENTWKQLVPAKPFEYFYLNQELNDLYRAEANLSKVVQTFSGLAMIVACLGLFGLASFNASQRKKEIGIRKVLGSSISQILTLVFADYLLLLGIAITIACPLAFFGLDYWLTSFAYRISIPLIFFVLASLITVVIALLTVISMSLAAARANPVDSLREE
jgi:putative ABC transport system permease protein